MELIRLFTLILVLFGKSMVVYSQSLLGAVENILGLDDGPNENQQYAVSPTSRPNIPVQSNLLGSNPNLYNKDPNRRPNIGLNSNLSKNKLQKGLAKPAINLLNNQIPTNVQNSVMQKVNQGNYEDNDVKIAAQQFPALQQLLDRLKELNRQKELDKQKDLEKQTGKTTEAPTTTEKSKENPVEPKPHDKGKFKAIKKRKFYFQVLPVVPEDERKNRDMETVYFED